MVFGRGKKLKKALEIFSQFKIQCKKKLTEDSKMEFFPLFHLVRLHRAVAGYAFIILFIETDGM